VLQNHRHHAGAHHAATLDPLSSAAYFDGFDHRAPNHRDRDSPVTKPSTWLLRVGWRRHGLLGRHESPST
jgi:hypothetical protein